MISAEEGQTIFVSAAAGAVGSVVGQIAKNICNLKTIGSAGGAEKCELIKKFGFDHTVDYKSVSNAEELKAKLAEAAPDGIDMYFENVGGMHFDAAFASLAKNGRIAVCGGISQYNEENAAKQSVELMKMIYSFQRIEGFITWPWLVGQKGNFLVDMAKWWKEGKVVAEETFFEGIENWAVGFQSLFTGANKGKVVIRM